MENLGLIQTPTGAMTGAMGFEDLEGLRKALEAGYGTDMSALVGGGALRVQSLDTTLQAVLATQSHFRLFNKLPKPDAGATVDEWTEATDQGGFPGGTTNSETGSIAVATGKYARRVGLVKYMMTQCQVSFVQTLQNAIVESETIENQMGTLRLLRDAEHLSFYGDSSVVPTEYDGIMAQIASLDSADHVLDAEANSLASINLINKAAATIASVRNFGVPTDLFMSPLVQADFDTGLDPAFRVPLTDVPGGGIQLGAPVRGIRTSWGDIAANPDVFIQDEGEKVPFEVRYPAIAAANAFVPAAVTAVAAAGTAASKWGASHAGNYYYAVTGIGAKGQSEALVSSQVTVAATEKVTITITKSAGGEETGYAIYRGRKNGTNAVADMRLVKRVARTGASTVLVDENRDIPGCTEAFILNLNPGYTAMTWRKLLPLTKFQLFPVSSAIVPWALLLFGYLRISKRQQHVVIKNILPHGSAWRPFG
jgi:hypothetical protein